MAVKMPLLRDECLGMQLTGGILMNCLTPIVPCVFVVGLMLPSGLADQRADDDRRADQIRADRAAQIRADQLKKDLRKVDDHKADIKADYRKADIKADQKADDDKAAADQRAADKRAADKKAADQRAATRTAYMSLLEQTIKQTNSRLKPPEGWHWSKSDAFTIVPDNEPNDSVQIHVKQAVQRQDPAGQAETLLASWHKIFTSGRCNPTLN
jgi:hypothetical protein